MRILDLPVWTSSHPFLRTRRLKCAKLALVDPIATAANDGAGEAIGIEGGVASQIAEDVKSSCQGWRKCELDPDINRIRLACEPDHPDHPLKGDHFAFAAESENPGSGIWRRRCK